jgi:galactokinase/mevalonate kinase-like predicted kinase
LHDYKRDFISLKQLAEEACHIEIERLQEPLGKQDQYISTFGGITAFNFEKMGMLSNFFFRPVFFLTKNSGHTGNQTRGEKK